MPQPDALITIAITCYNAADTICRAIESAINQDWPNTEIFIIDDKSHDNSQNIVANFIASIPQATLVSHTKNKGPAGARNTALAKANGDFIVFFDDDDESYPNRIRCQKETIEEYERQHADVTAIACYASGERHYPNGYVMPINAIGSRGAEKPNGPALADYLLFYRRVPNWYYGAGTPTCSLMARRKTFQLLEGFDENLRRVEDADLAIRLALMGGHFIGSAPPPFSLNIRPMPSISHQKKTWNPNKYWLLKIKSI